MIRRFNKITGKSIEKIYGQERLAYSMSGNEDLYDLIEWSKRGGYQGSVICFYDLETGDVYQPFEKKANVVYGQPAFAEGSYYFLKGDYDEGSVILYRYLPGETPEAVVELKLHETDLYNLRVIGNPIHIVSQDDVFRCYYPEAFSFPLQPNETVCLIEDGKVYIEAWIEEGWDDENDCATDAYDFYHRIITKDFEGNTISEETGCLCQAADGTWWIS